jgi:hypothetical protein
MASAADQRLLLDWNVKTKGNTVVSDAASVITIRSIRGVEKKWRVQSSLLRDRPGSLVGGVRSCEELLKLDSCFSGSL